MHQGATSYFKHLYELLLSTEVTDAGGKTMPLDEGVDRVVKILRSLQLRPGKVMAIGNGGSAAIASHMQNDLCKAVGVRVMDFSQVPLLTALSNDDGYECVFERPVELWADPDDLLVAISSSGRSENIIRAAKAAAARGCQIITLSGFNANNPLRTLGNVNFYVPSPVYGYVESAHSVITHFLTDYAVMLRKQKRSG